MKESRQNTVGGPLGRRLHAGRICAAAVIYIGLAVYLYQPYLKHFKIIQYIIGLNSILAALGCFVLSRRWISAFAASVFAGVVYGFSPFAFGFAAYHPLAGVPLAILPWLFCPAAFWRRWFGLTRKSFWAGLVTAGLSLLPFVVIAFFFWACAQESIGPFFPLPKNAKLHLAGMLGLVTPLALKPHNFIFGFYHIPTVVGLMGLFIYSASARIGVMIIAAAGLCLAFCDSVFHRL